MVDYVILVNAHILGPEQIPWGLEFDNDSRNLTIIQDGGEPTVNIPDTWRPVVDNLTSTDSTSSLSAKQGKILNDKIQTNSLNITNLSKKVEEYNKTITNKVTSEVKRLDDRIDSIPLSDYLTIKSFNATIKNYYTSTQIDDKLKNYQVKGDYVTNASLDSKLLNYQPKGDYPTRDEVTNNFSEYVTKYELAKRLGDVYEAGDNYVTNSSLNKTLENYVSKTYLSSELENYQKAGDYVTNASLTEKLTGYQPKGSYALSSHTHPWSDITDKPTLTYIVEKTATLSSSKWTGTTTPYSYDLGSEYADKSVVVGFNATSGTKEQLEAVSDAVIQGGSGTQIFAYGTKPSVDIPVILQISELKKEL